MSADRPVGSPFVTRRDNCYRQRVSGGRADKNIYTRREKVPRASRRCYQRLLSGCMLGARHPTVRSVNRARSRSDTGTVAGRQLVTFHYVGRAAAANAVSADCVVSSTLIGVGEDEMHFARIPCAPAFGRRGAIERENFRETEGGHFFSVGGLGEM